MKPGTGRRLQSSQPQGSATRVSTVGTSFTTHPVLAPAPLPEASALAVPTAGCPSPSGAWCSFPNHPPALPLKSPSWRSPSCSQCKILTPRALPPPLPASFFSWHLPHCLAYSIWCSFEFFWGVGLSLPLEYKFQEGRGVNATWEHPLSPVPSTAPSTQAAGSEHWPNAWTGGL